MGVAPTESMTGGLLSPTHVLFVVLVALIVLGPKRLPEVARAIGKGVRELRDTVEGPASATRSLFEDDPADVARQSAPPAAVTQPPDTTSALAPTAPPVAEDGAAKGAAHEPAGAQEPARQEQVGARTPSPDSAESPGAAADGA